MWHSNCTQGRVCIRDSVAITVCFQDPDILGPWRARAKRTSDIGFGVLFIVGSKKEAGLCGHRFATNTAR